VKPGQIRWLFVVVFGLLIFVTRLVPPLAMGVSIEKSADTYRFQAGTAPWGLAMSGLIIFLYIVLMYAEPSEPGQPLEGVLRRFVAGWLDFFLALFGITPILGILPVVVEWRRTGVFQWTLERDIPARGDGLISALLVIVMAIALLFYFAFPILRRKPSPGSCILGYQVVPEGEYRLSMARALQRILLGFVALCAWFVTPFVARDRKKGKLWPDKVLDTQAIRFR
jgi:uncharacterized RDD family membrane protein YckC